MDDETMNHTGTAPPEPAANPPPEPAAPATPEPAAPEPAAPEAAAPEPAANPPPAEAAEPEKPKKAVDYQTKKYQLTFNNPIEHGFSHDEIKLRLEQFKSLKYYCLADEKGLETGTPHTHLFLLFKSPVRTSRIEKAFPDVHLERVRGPAAANRDYIMKSGKWFKTDKAKTSIPGTFEEWGDYSELGQGYRTDLDDIQAMLDDGLRPSEILRGGLHYHRYEKMVKAAYFDKRNRETPVRRKVAVHYLVGESGTGKTNTYADLCDKFGEGEVYSLDDYSDGGFDKYEGQRILFIDEFKGQLRYGDLLVLTDIYKKQRHARYANILMLWNDVYISTVYPPEELYSLMVPANLRERDTIEQLYRRITDITYHYIDEEGKFRKYTIPMREYLGYAQLQQAALEQGADTEGFVEVDLGEQLQLPFS